jgi:hypothetical protein
VFQVFGRKLIPTKLNWEVAKGGRAAKGGLAGWLNTNKGNIYHHKKQRHCEKS